MEKQENKEALIEKLLKDRLGDGNLVSSAVIDCCGGDGCGCGDINDVNEG